jgi:hypothetical protein
MINLPSALLALLLGLPAVPSTDPSVLADLVAQLEASLERGDLDRAIQAGEKAVEADPGSSVAHDLLGRA